jgi:5-methylthioribose kinase
MTPQEVVAWAKSHVANDPIGAAQLGGGLMNEVWRIEGSPMVVLKIYSDRSRESPGVELTTDRGRFEAAALQLFEHDDDLSNLGRGVVEVPRVVHFEPMQAMLAMTHIDHESDIGVAIRQGRASETEAAEIGAWLGALHLETRHRVDLLRRFKNAPVQRTRLRVQYAAVEDTLEEVDADVDSARLREAGRRALALGRTLLEPGECLVMGDMWPRSVLVGDGTLGVIDWEFCHFGRALQDVAHFAAHLWLLADGADDRIASIRLHHARSAFLEAYFRAAPSWEGEDYELAAVHAGAEIVMRTYGAFADPSLFVEDGHREAAAVRGIDAIMGDWSPLHP